jgi:CBS domain containing-hemolysin-like protein
MVLAILTLSGVLLLALNAFFVLAEFAVVKVRPTQVATRKNAGDRRALVLEDIQARLDEYLSVCQVGITLASVALGMVGKKATDILLGAGEHDMLRYALAIGISYVIVSGSHIVIGELVPKSVAIRISERAALACAKPLRFFHYAFWPALWLLNLLANGILRLIGMGRASEEGHHSEQELRLILEQSQERGLMSFRRLLLMENVFDFGGLTVADAMRPREHVRSLDARRPWAENQQVILRSHFTRYPLVIDDPERPSGLVHVKDLVLRAECDPPDIAALARPILTTAPTTPLESLLTEMQRKRIHAALVTDTGGAWVGLISLEDVIEELVGTIRDEFEDEEPVTLSEALTPERIQLGIEAPSPMAAVQQALSRLPPGSLPLPAEQILAALEERRRTAAIYLGNGVGLPNARVAGLKQPLVLFLRSTEGLACENTTEKAHLLFVLLTPAGQARVHQRLQSTISLMLQESEYVLDRLMTATSPAEVHEAVRAGEQAALG